MSTIFVKVCKVVLNIKYKSSFNLAGLQTKLTNIMFTNFILQLTHLAENFHIKCTSKLSSSFMSKHNEMLIFY